MTRTAATLRSSCARALITAGLVLLPWLAPTPRAFAQAGCVPPAGGVPYLPGPPQWVDPAPPSGTTRPDVDDPRWVGSLRQDFPTQFGTEATFRALNAGGRLYFTFQSLTDPNGTTLGDTIWLGVGSGANSHLLMFDLDGAAGAGPTAVTFSYFTKAGGGAGGWTPGIPPAWAQAMARWVGGGADPYAWVVNLQVEAAGAGLGASFKLWYAITVNLNGLPLTTALYQWPVGGVSTTAPENVFDQNSVDPDQWGDANSGSAGSPCTGGISLAWNQIGADPPPVNQISTVADNQFFALPDYGSFAVVADMIQARFRFADWGSTITDKQNAPWVDIALPAAGAHNDAAGQIRFTCTNGAPTPATPACPAPSAGNPNHQCMLVELSKTPQPPGVVPNLFFSRDSAYRNMDFVAASRFESQAAIDIRGLPALASGPTRDVYLYVKTRNMPAPGTQAIELPAQGHGNREAPRGDAAAADRHLAAARQARRGPGPAARARPRSRRSRSGDRARHAPSPARHARQVVVRAPGRGLAELRGARLPRHRQGPGAQGQEARAGRADGAVRPLRRSPGGALRLPAQPGRRRRAARGAGRELLPGARAARRRGQGQDRDRERGKARPRARPGRAGTRQGRLPLRRARRSERRAARRAGGPAGRRARRSARAAPSQAPLTIS